MSRYISPGFAFTSCLVILFSFSFSIIPFALAENPAELFPLDSKPFGLSYEDHIKNYWKLLLSLPVSNNPMEDKTGEKCTTGQENSNSSVFYLAGNTGGGSVITCKIRSGLSVFIPIITVEASQAEVPKATIDDLHKIARNDQDHVTSLYLKVNNTEFNNQDLMGYRTHTKEFPVVFPSDALFGASAGPSMVVADGYYVLTKPLPEGNYTINIKSSLACLNPDCLEPTFASDIKYNLIVE